MPPHEQGIRHRALEWIRREPETLSDQVRPWEHGTVYRSSRYPRYSNVNTVHVTSDPQMSADELISFAESALAGCRTLRLEFADADYAPQRLRAGFEARGFWTMRSLCMRLDAPAPAATGSEDVTEVDYDAAEPLRVAWQLEDFPGSDHSDYLDQARAARIALGVRTLIISEGPTPIGFAAIDAHRGQAEVAALYVAAAHRGRGLGTKLATAAIGAVGDVSDLWILADDEDRPKRLYERLGFRPVLVSMLCLRFGGVSRRAPRSASQVS